MEKRKERSVGLYWLFAMIYWEILVHWGMYGQFQRSFLLGLGFTAALGLLVGALVGCLPKGWLGPGSLVLSLFFLLLYGSQLVYCFIFGTPYSVSQMGLGADAVGQFWKELLTTMRNRLPWVLSLLLPPVILGLLMGRQRLVRPVWKIRLLSAVLSIVTAASTYAVLGLSGTGMFSNYYFFTSPKSTTAQTMERFGVPTTFYVELTHTQDHDESMDLLPVLEAPAQPAASPTQPEADEAEPEYNILDIDFDALSERTEDPALLALNSYCAGRSGTVKNDRTGLLRDYNLILICAESFSPAAVDPVITPTLYRLTHEGYLFNNFYCSFPNTTTDGEYALTQGLFADSARGKENSSMLASAKNLLPFTLANCFQEQLGVKSWGYHNNIGDYYMRRISHPNMGYDMKFNLDGMKFSSTWPTSDLEMMEQSVDDYINAPQFHAYYMTFSGHYLYEFDRNNIAQRNRALVENLPGCSGIQKAYLSCHIELDKAMEYLLNRLEEAGIADRTAIVMVSDHTPYGLYRPDYFDLIGEEDSFFGWYKSNLVFWIGGMEPVEVNEYCCNIDVLPTLLNLWGLDYDSRLLPGTDIFSDGLHAAVLVDHSFLTDQLWYNTNTNEVTFLTEADSLPEDYVEQMNQLIAARFDFCTQVLRNDYYRFLFEEPEPEPTE